LFLTETENYAENVEFDQLCPELKEMIEEGSVRLNVALRAQRFAQLAVPFDPGKAVRLATEFNRIATHIQVEVMNELESQPYQDLETVIEKTSKALQRVNLTLASSISTILAKYADDRGIKPSDAVNEFTAKCLKEAGYQ